MKSEKEIRDKLARVCHDIRMAESDADFATHFIKGAEKERRLLEWILGEEEK